jgi:hypothetical protein
MGEEALQTPAGGLGKLRLLLALELTAGGGLGAWGVLASCRLYGREPLAVTLSRGGTCIALLMLTAAYAAARWRGARARATLFYPASYAVLGLVVDEALRGWAKEFAPAHPDELPLVYAAQAVQVALGLGLGVALFRSCRPRG